VNLTREDVQDILRLLDDASFDELQLETERFRLTLRRSEQGGWTQETRTFPNTREAASPSVPEPRARSSASESTTPAPGTIDIPAPIIGTFYRASKPGAPPFVEVGSRVEPDTVIGIVETMKLMSSVCAGAHGTIAAICVDNGAFVEQNQVLMRIDPAEALISLGPISKLADKD
jgi:acetyl-CoA carboxylase biotin carboxyl carrier protein